MSQASIGVRAALLAAMLAGVAGPVAAGAASARVSVGAQVVNSVEVVSAAEVGARLAEPVPPGGVVVDARGTPVAVPLTFTAPSPAEATWITVLPDAPAPGAS